MEEYIQTHSSHLRQTPTSVGTSCDTEKSADTSNKIVWKGLIHFHLINWMSIYKPVLQLLLFSGMETYRGKKKKTKKKEVT